MPSAQGALAANGSARQPHGRVTFAEVLGAATETELQELFGFWARPPPAPAPRDAAEVRRAILEFASDDVHVEARVLSLGRRMNQVLSLLLEAPHFQLSFAELSVHKQIAYLSRHPVMLLPHDLRRQQPR